MTRTWGVASRFKIEIRDSEAKLQPSRTNDRFLMEDFATAGFCGQELSQLNICRMFLHAVTLADVCTVDGLAITLESFQGRRDPSCGTNYSWPRVQSSLPGRYWNLWQQALLKCFLVAGSSRALRDPLGRWLHFPPCWQWFYSSSEDRLYKKEGLMWRAFPVYRVRTSARLGHAKYRRSDNLLHFTPMNLIPVSVTIFKDWVIIVATSVLIDQPVVQPPRNLSLAAISARRTPSFNWAISEMSLSDGIEIAQALTL
jgi:hypothetical protein